MSARIRRRVWDAVGWVLIGLMGLGALACSKPNAINPEDAARVRKIDAMVERIRQAYVSKDAEAFRALFTPQENLHRLQAAAQSDFATFDRINLDFTIDRVMVEGPDVSVYFHWQGQWQQKKDDQPLRERGHAILRLVGQQTLVLNGVDGDVPFGMAARRIPAERSR